MMATTIAFPTWLFTLVTLNEGYHHFISHPVIHTCQIKWWLPPIPFPFVPSYSYMSLQMMATTISFPTRLFTLVTSNDDYLAINIRSKVVINGDVMRHESSLCPNCTTEKREFHKAPSLPLLQTKRLSQNCKFQNAIAELLMGYVTATD